MPNRHLGSGSATTLRWLVCSMFCFLESSAQYEDKRSISRLAEEGQVQHARMHSWLSACTGVAVLLLTVAKPSYKVPDVYLSILMSAGQGAL